MTTSRKKQPPTRSAPGRRIVVPKVGDYALMANSTLTLPGDWLMVEVLWTDGVDVLTSHVPASQAASGETYRQVFLVERVVRAGTWQEMHEFKSKACRIARDHQLAIGHCEQRLGALRKRAWGLLDRLMEEA